jgi:hypothetical protein
MKNQLKTNPIQPFNRLGAIVVLAWFGLIPLAQAVVPAPAGGYPGFNTAQGQNALFSLTTGIGNTAAGWSSLKSNTDGSFNTAVGAATLLFNVGDQDTGEGIQNTAIGGAALLSNTTGACNTANGALALFTNTTGSRNSANGAFALFSNTEGYYNTAIGYQALFSNTMGYENTANGAFALDSNTTGNENTASGWGALAGNTEGGGNTATGNRALQFSGASVNSTAVGNNALQLASGNLNTALGAGAGQNQTSGTGNVYIGALMSGTADENDTTYIRNVYDSQTSARAVYINADNKIGTLSSSRRYKEDIGPMDRASESIFALKPVTFRYKKEIDRSQALSFGLIAEEVAEISPDLITRDQEGKPQTVRYEAVNAMLLNEFLKEHRKVEKLEATLEAVNARLQEQAGQIQRVTAQVDATKPLAHLALNNP